MSRRDTIIVAVLVNAALLMILFATAVRSDDSEKKKQSQSVGNQLSGGAQLVEGPKPPPPSKNDLLNQYISSVPTLAEKQSEELVFHDEAPIALTSTHEPHPIKEEVPSLPSLKKKEYVDITVKKGDFLEKIAKANNTTVASLMQVNQLTSTQLRVGQVLKVPLSDDVAKASAKVPSQESEYYVVKEGDNPWLIASRNHIQLEELLRLNGLDDYKAKRIRPGDKLRIR